MPLPPEYYSQLTITALNKLTRNFIKTKKYDEIKSILASKNSYSFLGLYHAIASFDLEAYKLIVSYAKP